MDNEGSAAMAHQPAPSRISKANHKTLAAKFNRRMYSELGRALQNDPEADLTGFLSDSYSKRLKSYKGKYPICIYGQFDVNAGLIQNCRGSRQIKARARPCLPAMISAPDLIPQILSTSSMDHRQS